MLTHMNLHIQIASSTVWQSLTHTSKTNHFTIVDALRNFYFNVLFFFQNPNPITNKTFFFWNFASTTAFIAYTVHLKGTKDRALHFVNFAFAVASFAVDFFRRARFRTTSFTSGALRNFT